ncbi:MAG: EAL domain-containing protein [Lachnospiraceae bacterium]|nr:EAL domain-containing protein [Lachnospiraceae bacterium]
MLQKDFDAYMDSGSLADHFSEIFEAFSYTADGKYVYICHIPTDYSIWSQEAVDYFGLPASVMRNAGDIWLEHIAPEDREAYEKNIQALFDGSSSLHDMHYRAKNKSGRYVTCSCKGLVIRDDDGKPKYFAGTIVNHELEDFIDPVSGLYTNKELLRQMENFSRWKTPYFLIFIGIRQFGKINATYGYNFANKILKRFGELLLSGKEHGSVFRLDGVKYAYLVELSYADKNKLAAKLDFLRSYVKKQLFIDGTNISLELSSSGMQVDDPSLDINTVHNTLTYALSNAKKDNSSSLRMVDDHFMQGNLAYVELLTEIRGSIKNGCKGFFLVYQPIINAETGKVTGAEALLRWADSQGNIVPPIRYIDWLERDALFYDLGLWILDTAMRDIRPLLDSYPDFIVNVNLAYPQLQRPEFNSALVSLLKKNQFPNRNLKLELTERCQVLNMDYLKDCVAYYRSIDISTALDDFGTGYSALTLMTTLPIQQIKIDKSFIDDIMEDRAKQSLLKAITTCAEELDKKVCVEGIENPELASYLKAHYFVTQFQGYYFSKPLTIDRLLSFV